MSELAPHIHEALSALVRTQNITLFMKGTRQAPQCGFSARVVQTLDGLVDDYATVNILSDPDLRENMKVFASWPTYPQLWVGGEFIGGADIIGELAASGELASLLGATAASPPEVTLTDRAAARIREVLEGEDAPLRLIIGADFSYRFDVVEAAGAADVEVRANGIRLVLDRASAKRADGMSMDFVDGPKGPSLVVENPNEPARVQALTVRQLATWREQGQPHTLIDVRTPAEVAIAKIDGSVLLTDETLAELLAGPKDGVLVFQCHHGVRSQSAAEHFLQRGFRRVFNLTGGVDAWSTHIDEDVPTY